MWKRLILSLAFVGALGFVGLGAASTAEARHGHGCYRGGSYAAFYYGGGYAPYYSPAPYYGYRRTVRYYDGPRYYPRHHHGGVSFSIGF